VAELHLTVKGLSAQVQRMGLGAIDEDDDLPRDQQRPWSLEGYGPDELDWHIDQLAPWVKWLRTMYDVANGPLLPVCWAEHSGLVAELLTLHESWRVAFIRPRGVEKAQRWHEQNLPGLLSRVHLYAARDCLTGHHVGRVRGELPL
jgi:hypothetical protein